MKLLEQVRQTARAKHFSYRTGKAYVYWAERYIRFHGIRHPNVMGTGEIEQFLTHLAIEGHVSASTQNQALAALLFLYQDVLKIDVGRLDAVRARRPKRIPLVLSMNEVSHGTGSGGVSRQRFSILLQWGRETPPDPILAARQAAGWHL
jgi:site-specific recombinase XerD